MSPRLPKKLIDIPEDCDPRTRQTMGGRGNCEHHYRPNADKQHSREWICLNCDRLCTLNKWDHKGGSL